MRGKQSGLLFLAAACLILAGCGTAADKTQSDNASKTEVESETEAKTESGEDAAIIEEPESEEEMTADSQTEKETQGQIEAESEAGAEPKEEQEPATTLPGASLNGTQFAEGEDAQRVTYAEDFYYEPISDELLQYITGTSYPEAADGESFAITRDDLRYVHVLYCDFDGKTAEGELICNAAIAQDLTEIFHELYENGYQIEQIHLVDEYGGDDEASMAANNTSCFNYRNVANSSSLSKHALGRAVDINPLYNPYVTYNSDGGRNVQPEEGWDYVDRSADFAHKIDTNDLCYQVFTEHGFTWGGSWNSSKDYQHFQKE
ncbi:MAG: M15 family metallopeptidase [Lachnospiraceae bacterium]|nr:M15 family metallopeptidase [Lachnospiraceae bacterium]